MESRQIIEKTVSGGVVIDNGKALILQRGADEDSFPNMWELPSGKVEEGESVEQALLREIKEETGLDVEIVKHIYNFEYEKVKEGQTFHYTQHNFLVKPTAPNQEVVLSNEHQAFTWVREAELDNYSLSDESKSAIRVALSQK